MDERLAIHGGRPVRSRPWLENLTFGEEERQAALRVLEGGRLSLFEGNFSPDPPFSFWGGPEVQRLERLWAERYGVGYAVSMNSATSGLIASIGALGIGYGDEVIVSPYTMSAAASCVLVYGAIPVFADVRLETGSLDPASVERCVSPRTRAIVVVHQFGIPAGMEALTALARKHRLKIVEDCAQAHGARIGGRFVGSFGDIGVFSLNANKTIQTGEGGVCVTRDPELHHRLALIRNHGEAVVEQTGAEGGAATRLGAEAGAKGLANLIGFNFRMTELTAAVALEQLRKLDGLNQIRCAYVEQLSQALARYPFLIPPPPCAHAPWGRPACSGCRSTYYLYPLRFLPETAGISRSEFARLLSAEGIPFAEGYARPLYLQPLYQTRQAFKYGYPFTAPVNQGARMDYRPGLCPNAEKLHFEQMLINECVRPPHTGEDIQDIARGVEKVASLIPETVR